MGAFSVKFSTTPIAAKLWTGPKMFGGEMMARTTSIIELNVVEIEQHTSV